MDTNWSIVASCFIISAFITGMYRGYGIIFVVLLKTLNINREKASWPMSLGCTLVNLTGLLSGALNSYLSSGIIACIGCSIASLGIILCFFSRSIFDITIFIGLIEGIGSGLAVMQIPVIINQHFKKYRTTANGIALTGSTVGSFVIPIISQYLLQKFDFNYCYLILGSLMAIFTLPASFFLHYSTKKENNAFLKILECICKKYLNSKETLSKTNDKNINIDLTIDDYKCGIITIEKSDNLKLEDTNSNGENVKEDNVEDKKPEEIEEIEAKEEKDKIIEDKDISKFNNFLISLIYILKNPVFIIVCLAHISFIWSFTTLIMVIVDFSYDYGIINDESALILTLFAISDLIGRISFGTITDHKFITHKNALIIYLFLLGLSLTLGMKIISTSIALFILIIIIGLIIGSLVTLFSVVYIEYIGIAYLPCCLGISSFTIGLSTIARPMVVGYFRDIRHSYTDMFTCLGSICIFVSALLLMQSICEKKRKRTNC